MVVFSQTSSTDAPAEVPEASERDALHFVFDGFPGESGPHGPRLVEVETPDGKSISAGEWRRRADGLTELIVRTGGAPSFFSALEAIARDAPTEEPVNHGYTGNPDDNYNYGFDSAAWFAAEIARAALRSAQKEG